MSIEIIGINATVAAIGSDIDQFMTELDGLIQDAGMECEDLAVAACPVDTGNLQESITYLPDFLSCEVYTDVDYAVYVELGTSKMAPQEFMLPAFETAKDHLLQELGV